MRRLIFGAAAVGLTAVALCGGAAAQHEHHQMSMSGEEKAGYAREVHDYTPPAVDLIDQNGDEVRFDKFMNDDRPMLVQFIFTSCTTICPVMGAVFGGAQEDVAEIAPDYRMVSISIDPEYDTPERLREFAAKQGAHGDWVLFTGRYDDIQKVIKAFDVLNQGDNKMYHQPYTFIRWKRDDRWVRLRGLMSVADLVKEFKNAQTPMMD